MKSIIVIGSEDSRNKYITDYIKKNRIKSFNIVKFDDRLKISDVREIKKIVSIKQPPGEKRIFILSSDITTDAQNALLKTLEELPNDSDILFLAKTTDIFLPTIVSRSFIVNAGIVKDISGDSSDYENILIESICNTTDKKKIFVDFLMLSNKISSLGLDELERLLLSLRNVMLKIAKKEIPCNKTSLQFICKLISSFTQFYPLLERNNLNKKLTLDYIFINTLFP